MTSTLSANDEGTAVRKTRRRRRKRCGASRVESNTLTGTDDSVEDTGGSDFDARDIVPKIVKQANPNSKLKQAFCPIIRYKATVLTRRFNTDNHFATLSTIENASSTAPLRLAPPQTAFTFACSRSPPTVSSTAIATTSKSSDQAPLPSSPPKKPRKADYSCREWFVKPAASILNLKRQTSSSSPQKGSSIAPPQGPLIAKPDNNLVKPHPDPPSTKLTSPLSTPPLSPSPDSPPGGWPEITYEPLAPATKDRKSRFYPDSSDETIDAQKEPPNSKAYKDEKRRPPALALDLAFAVIGKKGYYIPITPLSAAPGKEITPRAESRTNGNLSRPRACAASFENVALAKDTAEPEQLKKVSDNCEAGECDGSAQTASSGSEWEGKDDEFWG